VSVPFPSLAPPEPAVRRPRIGFIGAGWIGQNRMKAIAQQNSSELVGIVEPNSAMATAAREIAPTCMIHDSIDALLNLGLDGVAIATPSALHAEQAILALERGVSVFCQKPLARNREETQRVVDAARAADRLLRVDFSYRFLQGVRQIRELIQSGALGGIYIVDLTFHNAYGPDKAWFYDPRVSGGGCVMDLGIHLVDLVLWSFNYPAVREVSGSLLKAGKYFHGCTRDVEDFATASLRLDNDVVAQLRCSWRTHAGCEAVIEYAVYGTHGGARLHNVNGSFYDFQTERFFGTRTEILSAPPENWGGRAAAEWLYQLSFSNRFEPDAEHFVDVAAILDRIYSL
jgi:predicted dehydrogenase